MVLKGMCRVEAAEPETRFRWARGVGVRQRVKMIQAMAVTGRSKLKGPVDSRVAMRRWLKVLKGKKRVV